MVSTVSTFKSVAGKTAEQRAHEFGMFVLGGALGNVKAANWCREHGVAVRAQSESLNASGGFFVPEQFVPDIIANKERYGVFARRARRVPMSSDTASYPIRAGGITISLRGEGRQLSESDLEFGNATLEARKMGALTLISNELFEDSAINLGNLVADEMAHAWAQQEDQCGFNGDGSSTYYGIVGVRERLKGLSATIANIAGLQVAGGNLYSELILADFLGVAALLPEYASPGAAWYMHRDFYYNHAARVATAAGNQIAAEFNNTIGTARPMFLGYPVEMTQVMPRVEGNSQVCALLGDLGMAALLGLRDMRVESDRSIKFAEDQIAIKAIERFDINVHSVGNATATASAKLPGPIVGLITAAS